MHVLTTKKKAISLNGLPNSCPFCHRLITPRPLIAQEVFNDMEVIFSCPNNNCQRCFIGLYCPYIPAESLFSFSGKITKGNLTNMIFSNIISEISKSFTLIYNEAHQAEQQNLLEICGVGYRKAFEFLIKDYLIRNHPDDKSSIENGQLSWCISKYIKDNNINPIAKRVTWLGNDQTHYIRKWEGNDLHDLKTLINLTIHWIEMLELSNKFISSMPE